MLYSTLEEEVVTKDYEKRKKVFYIPKDEVERYNIGSIDLLNYNNGGCLKFGKLEKSGRFF